MVRPTLFNYIFTEEEFEHYTNRLWELVLEQKFTVRIHGTYPLQDVAQAHEVSPATVMNASDQSNSTTRIWRADEQQENCC